MPSREALRPFSMTRASTFSTRAPAIEMAASLTEAARVLPS